MLIARPFWFLRHGETDYNAQGLIQGYRDIPLNATGRAQAAQARDRLARDRAARQSIVRIVASPLRRALETAETVNQALKLPITIDPDLRECGFGRYEGTVAGPWYEGWRAGQAAQAARGSGPDADPEPHAAFLARGLSAVNAALTGEGQVLIVAHGGIFWSIHHHGALAGERGLANAQPIHLQPPAPPCQGWSLTTLDEFTAG